MDWLDDSATVGTGLLAIMRNRKLTRSLHNSQINTLNTIKGIREKIFGISIYAPFLDYIAERNRLRKLYNFKDIHPRNHIRSFSYLKNLGNKVVYLSEKLLYDILVHYDALSTYTIW